MTEKPAQYGAPERVTVYLEHWPDASLSPNSRKDRRSSTAIRQAARMEARTQVIDQGARLPDNTDLKLTVWFYPPNLIGRDLDNSFTMLKPTIDGMCKALEIDDRNIKTAILLWREVQRPRGAVRLRLEVAQDGRKD